MTTTTLKLLALLFMLMDHIGQFIPHTPAWFGWIGRISAPLFMYCVIWGFTYTSSKISYLIRLYIFGIGMAIINVNLNIAFNEYFYYITNNFITTLFIVALVIFIIDKGEKKYYIYFAVWQVLTTIITIVFINFLEIPKIYDIAGAMFYAALFGNVFLTEGGILFIILGVILYLTRNNKICLIILYSGFTTFIYLLVRRYGHHLGLIELLIPFPDYQWMMIAALPFMLLYNRKKGIGLKYFFYIFYPLHLIILFLLGAILG